MKKSRWTTEEQRKHIGSAMAIATTARLLFGLRWTRNGREYANWMVTHGGMDRELCDAGTRYILIPMLPFAVELCLKGIRSLGGAEFIYTHNLKSLWNDLDEAERTEIRRGVNDTVSRSEWGTRRKALDITNAMRTVDQVIEIHQNDFKVWRYVANGERSLMEERKRVRIDEALMDLHGIVCACVEYHQSRGVPQR